MKEATINSRQSLESYKKFLDDQFEKHKFVRVKLSTGRQRTLTQNAAMHKYFEMVAEALNDAGFDFRTFVKDGYAVPFTPALVKDHFWRTIQNAMLKKKSTTKLERTECAQIYDVLNNKLIEHGIYVPWPSEETLNDH